mgnify:CR=1 FL=1
MKSWRKYAAVLSVLALRACAALEEGNVLPDPSLDGGPMTKVAKFNNEYDEGTLLVKFRSVPSEEALAGIRDIDVYRMGIGKETAFESGDGLVMHVTAAHEKYYGKDEEKLDKALNENFECPILPSKNITK